MQLANGDMRAALASSATVVAIGFPHPHLTIVKLFFVLDAKSRVPMGHQHRT